MIKAIVILLAAVLIIGGIFALKSAPIAPQTSSTDTGATSVADQAAQNASTTAATSTDSSTVSQGPVKEFTVTGANFSFSPNTISVKKGDTVKITFKNAEGYHDLRLDDFGVFTKMIVAGAEDTIQFVANRVGSFEYYCSVGSHRQMGMKGTLTVSE